MKTTTILAWSASLIWSVEGLVAQQRRQSSGPKVVGLETERRHVSDPLARDRMRRRDTVEADLDNEETLYFINMTVGTPARSLRLHIDTGSSDLWVNTPSSKLCSDAQNKCDLAGTYSANRSSTYEYIGSWFNISYVDGSGASGDYVSDTVTVGGAKLDRLQFGIGYSSSNAQGILGIGYKRNEVQVGRAGLDPYDNLPAQMVTDGLINSNAYSIWLNDLDSNRGNILFGGVDTEKFEGTLQTMPIQTRQRGYYAEFLITMTGFKFGETAIGGDDMATAVLLDTGSSLTYLPDSMVQDIYNSIPSAQYDSELNAAYVPCDLAQNSTKMTFAFSGPEITVGFDELVLDLVADQYGNRLKFTNGQDACLFGVAPAGTGTNVLGDTFLRSAYVVYDMDNNEISIAQTKFNATTSRILEIGTGDNAVPGAQKVENPITATAGLGGQGILDPDSAAPAGLLSRAPGMMAGLVALGVAAFIL